MSLVLQSFWDIEKGLGTLALSTVNTEFVEEQIAEYKEHNSLELWSDENFRWLSRRLTDILGVRTNGTALLPTVQADFIPEVKSRNTLRSRSISRR